MTPARVFKLTWAAWLVTALLVVLARQPATPAAPPARAHVGHAPHLEEALAFLLLDSAGEADSEGDSEEDGDALSQVLPHPAAQAGVVLPGAIPDLPGAEPIRSASRATRLLLRSCISARGPPAHAAA